MGHIVEDIKLETQAFQQWQLTFTRREENRVAHLLAKYAVKHDHNFYWRDTSPNCIRGVLLLEQFALVA